MKFMKLFFIFLMTGLTACASDVTEQSGNTHSLNGLQDLSAPAPSVKVDKNKVTEMREDALKDVAMSLGAQSALHWRSTQINALLNEKSIILNQTYDFNRLLLSHNILPPVLSEGRQSLSLDGPDTIRLADRTYQIQSQAKFVTTTPTWRDYLWMSYPQPKIPAAGILPHDNLEIIVWRKYVKQGWKEGIEQANDIYAENLARLNRDYKGMVLYRSMRAQNIVSAPFVSRTELGVTGGGDTMNVNDQVLRITALPSLEPNSNRWKPALQTADQQ